MRGPWPLRLAGWNYGAIRSAVAVPVNTITVGDRCGRNRVKRECCGIDSAVRVSIPRHFVGLGLVEVSRDHSIAEQPPVVVPKDMRSIERLPRTHADVSAQYRVIDVFPFRAVAVPLNEGLPRAGTPPVCIDHMPGSHDVFASIVSGTARASVPVQNWHRCLSADWTLLGSTQLARAENARERSSAATTAVPMRSFFMIVGPSVRSI